MTQFLAGKESAIFNSSFLYVLHIINTGCMNGWIDGYMNDCVITAERLA